MGNRVRSRAPRLVHRHDVTPRAAFRRTGLITDGPITNQTTNSCWILRRTFPPRHDTLAGMLPQRDGSHGAHHDRLDQDGFAEGDSRHVATLRGKSGSGRVIP